MSAAFRHELIEFRLIPGESEPFEERTEFLLVIFHTAEGFGLILVERPVAGARCRPVRRPACPVGPTGPRPGVLSRLLIDRPAVTAKPFAG